MIAASTISPPHLTQSTGSTSKLDGGVASVTARWKASDADKGRTLSSTWKLEDGLWCLAP